VRRPNHFGVSVVYSLSPAPSDLGARWRGRGEGLLAKPELCVALDAIVASGRLYQARRLVGLINNGT